MDDLPTALLKILLPVIIGFALSAFVGNRLLQAWQMRSWLAQQRFLGHEKEYAALRELADQVASLLGTRIFHMQRVLRVLGGDIGNDFDIHHDSYRESVIQWNERLASFYVRLAMLLGDRFALNLERRIQNRLVAASSTIDALIRDTKAQKPISRKLIRSVRDDVNRLQGRAIEFNKSLLSAVQQRRTDVYYGKRISFTVGNLKHFSTWRLVKALFIRDIDLYSIARTPLDP